VCEMDTAGCVDVLLKWDRCDGGVFCGLDTDGCVDVHWTEGEVGVWRTL
jgi:hypothetical protein